MRILMMQQNSPEWWEAKCGSIGGTRLGQVMSNRKNRLVYQLINEKLNGYVDQNDFASDDMQFGIDNENEAAELYSALTGIDFKPVGIIKSDYSDMHHASPDRMTDSEVLEIKCTANGDIHIQRFFEGVESKYMDQVLNYFAVSDNIRRVHWVSYCPYREERPLVYFAFEAHHYSDDIKKIREKIKQIEAEVSKKMAEFIF